MKLPSWLPSAFDCLGFRLRIAVPQLRRSGTVNGRRQRRVRDARASKALERWKRDRVLATSSGIKHSGRQHEEAPLIRVQWIDGHLVPRAVATMNSASRPRVTLLTRSDVLHCQKSSSVNGHGRPPACNGSRPVRRGTSSRGSGVSGESLTARPRACTGTSETTSNQETICPR